MPGTKAFFDTNILLYLLSSDTAKANCVESILKNGGLISVQVLNEFTNVTRRKLLLPWSEITEILYLIRAICQTEPLTIDTHDKGRFLAERYNLSVYDAMIVSAALLGGCDTLYSEDMQNNLIVEKQLRIHNPFNT